MEYASALWQSVRLAWRERSFDIVHAANGPDLLFVVYLVLRVTGRVRFVFDQHDLAPELYLSRYGRRGAWHRLLRLFERISYRLATLVVSPNETYREVAIERGQLSPHDVIVVRNGPELSRVEDVAQDSSLKHGKRHLLCYVGVMGPQDGVEFAVRALAELRHVRAADDWHAVFIGDGEAFESVIQLSRVLAIDPNLTFIGRIAQGEAWRYLATADVGLSPDPYSSFNDSATMIKVVEYMAFGCPIVSFDLTESRRSAGEAAFFVPDRDVSTFATAISDLLDDPERRARMAAIGRRRVREGLAWDHARSALLDAYQAKFGPPPIYLQATELSPVVS